MTNEPDKKVTFSINEQYIINFDINEIDIPTVTVLHVWPPNISIINVIQGEDAIKIYELLTNKKVERR